MRRLPPAIGRRRASRRGIARAAGGFSLLEVLVAFVILSLVATALFGLFSGALNNATAADGYSRAVLIAESVLAEAAAAQPLRAGEAQGALDDGRITWRTSVAPYDPPDVNADLARMSDAMPTRLYRVSAEVTFAGPSGAMRTFALATTRVGSKETP